MDTQKKHQHDKLMDEFRKAHRKMFSSTNDASDEATDSAPDKSNNEKDSLAVSHVSRIYLLVKGVGNPQSMNIYIAV